MRRTGRPEVTVDLTAETFARALSGRGSFDPALGEALAWLFGIARHVLARSLELGRVEDETRMRMKMQPLVLDDDVLADIQDAGHGPALVALQGLPGDQRDAIRARIIDDHSYEQAAAELRCSESVVRQRVSRGLRALRAQLKESR